MKKAIFILAVFILPLATFSQGSKYEYTPKVKNRIDIVNLPGEISIINSGSNSISVESDFNIEKPERAEGLKLLGSMEDNTGMGVNVSEENGIVTISGVTKQVKDAKYTLAIPSGIEVSIDYSSPFASDDINIDSYNGSLEIKTLSANVTLTQCTGPFTVNSISGDIEVVFDNINQDEPSSLASVSGLIDVSVPANIKATIEISNITGNVYNNLDLKSETKEEKDSRAEGMKHLKFSDGNTHTLNGGGQKLVLNAVSGNIYLRKK